jgi:hypothetical protein
VFWQASVLLKQVTCHLNRVLICKPVYVFPSLCFLLRLLLLALETVNECGPQLFQLQHNLDPVTSPGHLNKLIGFTFVIA